MNESYTRYVDAPLYARRPSSSDANRHVSGASSFWRMSFVNAPEPVQTVPSPGADL